MIPRYEQPEIVRIWSDGHRFRTFLEVELAVLGALEEAGKAPAGTAERIRGRAVIDPDRILEIERETRHDVVAFCAAVSERLDPKDARFLHFGVTSSDVIDTALALQVRESLGHVEAALDALLSSLLARAREFRDTACMGRSHGMAAEPMSFGVKLLGHYAEFSRRRRDLADWRARELTAQFSGAVGNHAVLDPETEARAARALGLAVEPCSTQVVPRDRLAGLVGVHALLACAVERLAVEVRHLARSEVGEAREAFAKGQKGSSTMPHKRNPVACENLTGMARVLRSHHAVACENTVLWHERDISHSGPERLYLPDNLGLVLYSLRRLGGVVEGLVVDAGAMEARALAPGPHLSSLLLHRLIGATDLSRDELYGIVQKAAFGGGDLGKGVAKALRSRGVEARVPDLGPGDVRAAYLGSAGAVFERTLAAHPPPGSVEHP